MTRTSRAPRAPSPQPPRRAHQVALGASLAGLGAAAYLVHVHGQAHAGVASFCNINDTFNCDKVATSPYSVVLGVPVAVWGVLAYGAASLLAGWGLSTRRLHATWPSGLLFLLGLGAVAGSGALALVSELIIGAWCLFCMVSWSAAAVLLASAWVAVKGPGAGAAVGADLAALSARPAATGGVLVAGLALVGGLMAAYPRYWDHARPPPRPVDPVAAPTTPIQLRDPAEGAVLFSDYECPFCSNAHQELKVALAARPDIRVVKRHFPLDQSCNAAVKRVIHPDACRLARAAICAEAQGRFEEMDDLLYGNQQARRPVEALAAQLGLDLPRFQACLGSAETERRLQDDIAEAVRSRVKATPTYFVGGVEFSGHLPVEIFRKPGAPIPSGLTPAGGATQPAGGGAGQPQAGAPSRTP